MWGTADPAIAAEKATRAGYAPTYLADGSLRLTHVVGAPTRRHASDDREVWHSHLTNIQSTGWAAEQAKAARHLRSWRFAALAVAFRGWRGARRPCRAFRGRSDAAAMPRQRRRRGRRG